MPADLAHRVGHSSDRTWAGASPLRQAAAQRHRMGMNRILSVSIRRGIAVAVFALAAVLGGAGAAAASAAPAPYCGITWGSLPRAHDALSPAPLTDVRTGPHDC